MQAAKIPDSTRPVQHFQRTFKKKSGVFSAFPVWAEILIFINNFALSGFSAHTVSLF